MQRDRTCGILRALARNVVPKDHGRFALNAVNVHATGGEGGGRMTFEATDGRILVRVVVPWSGPAFDSMLVDGDVARKLKVRDVVRVEVEPGIEREAAFLRSVDGTDVPMPLGVGTFPDVGAVIPEPGAVVVKEPKTETRPGWRDSPGRTVSKTYGWNAAYLRRLWTALDELGTTFEADPMVARWTAWNGEGGPLRLDARIPEGPDPRITVTAVVMPCSVEWSEANAEEPVAAVA